MSAKFLNNPRRYDFWRVVRGDILPAAIAFLVLWNKFFLDALDSFDIWGNWGHGERTIYMYTDSLSYYLFGMIGCGAVMAAISFSFLLFRKKGDMLFGTQLTRSQMFINRAAAAFGIIFLTAAIPVCAMLYINVRHNGFLMLMLPGAIELFAALLIAGMLGFSAAAAAICLVGNIIEAGLLTGCFLIIPYLLICITDSLAAGYLKGNAYYYTGSYPLISNFYDYTTYDKLSVFSPFRFTLSSNADYNYCLITVPKNTSDVITVGFENVFPLVLWAVITVCVIIAAFWLFKRRKAEITGGVLSCKFAIGVYSFVCAAALFMTILHMFLNRYASGGFWTSFLSSSLLFCAVSFLLIRKPKKFVKSIWSVLIYSVPVLAIYLVLITGCFGYSGYIPDASEIEQIRITEPSGVFNSENAYNYTDSQYLRTSYDHAVPLYVTQAEDIEKITTLHKQLIKDRGKDVAQNVTITYTLKNNQTVARRYSLFSYNAFLKLAAVYDTDCARNLFKSLLLGEQTAESNMICEEDQADTYTGFGYSGCEYLASKNAAGLANESLVFFLYREDGSRVSKLNNSLKKEQIKELFEAIYNDYTSLDSIWFLDPPVQPYGYITLKNNFNTNTYKQAYPGYSLNIFPGMKNTISFLQNSGLYKKLVTENKPYSVKKIDYDFYDFIFLPNDCGYSPIGPSAVTEISTIIGNVVVNTQNAKPESSQSEQETVNNLYDASAIRTCAVFDAYLLEFTFADKTEYRFIKKDTCDKIMEINKE